MAEAIGLGSSILGIASFGASVVTTLHKLTTSYRGADAKINSLSSDIALTASILTSLGHTVKEYEVEFHLKADNFIPAREQCEKNFERLSKALRDVRKSDRKDKGATPWKKLMFALGGEDEIKDLMSEIESSKSTLQLLLDSVNLLVLKRLSKK
ncbi:hypothetical protein B0J14DRAFT_21998 [Halenospora varia]|nr:hypothetical protein B0J14DRAFT_21998 [Halenospora varia]